MTRQSKVIWQACSPAGASCCQLPRLNRQLGCQLACSNLWSRLKCLAEPCDMMLHALKSTSPCMHLLKGECSS